MKLVTYLQKRHWVTRREFSDMLRSDVISINGALVGAFDAVILEWDKLVVTLENGQKFEETAMTTFLRPKLVLFHKPKGCVVSKDDKHNKTIYEYLPDSWRKDFWYIWRLDKDSTGLMILANSPELVDRYESPENDIYKVYEVQIDKPYRTKDVKKATRGIDLTEDGEKPEKWDFYEHLKFVSVRYSRDGKGRYWLTITLNEGKKRHIRRVLKFLWYKIFKLHRVKVWKRHIWSLKPWKYRLQTKVK